MNGMSAPGIVGCQRDHTDDTTDPIVRTPVGKDRTVTAVVLSYEQARRNPAPGTPMSSEAHRWPSQ